ncbi:MAG TPA: carbohydrate binding domain-containing protein [Streptosporangiaceae bacterium]|jgi:hypothetical protein
MKTSRWKPLPADVMGAARELAGQLRLLMDRAGLSPRQLAADGNVPYDVTALQRFLSGRVLPPRQLVEVIAARCGGDREQLLSTLDRAVVARDAGLPWAAGTTSRPRRSLRDRPKLIVAAFIGFIVVTNAVTAAVVVRLTDRSSSEDAGGAARTAPPDPPQSAGVPTPARLPLRGTPPAPTKASLIRNGGFTGTTMSWWPVSDVRITADADRLRADVGGGSRERWDRIVSAASFPLRNGRTYTLTFDAAADADITDQVTVELDDQPYTEALSRKVKLTTSMRRFSYRFTANVALDQAALNFELGGHPNDHTVWLDNVTLIPA